MTDTEDRLHKDNDMHKFTLGIEVEPVVLGDTYSRMPLHCTLMPWFLSDRDPSEIESCVTAATASQPETVLRSLRPDLFGPNKNIPVHVLDRSLELVALHMDIFHALNDMGVTYTEPAYTEAGYRPHVSDSEGKSFCTGSEMSAERIYLVEAISHGKPRLKIVHAIITLP